MLLLGLCGRGCPTLVLTHQLYRQGCISLPHTLPASNLDPTAAHLRISRMAILDEY